MANLYLRLLIISNPKIKNLYKIRAKFFKVKANSFTIRAPKLMNRLKFNNFRLRQSSRSNRIRLHKSRSNRIYTWQTWRQTIFTRETSGSTSKSQTSRGTSLSILSRTRSSRSLMPLRSSRFRTKMRRPSTEFSNQKVDWQRKYSRKRRSTKIRMQSPLWRTQVKRGPRKEGILSIRQILGGTAIIILKSERNLSRNPSVSLNKFIWVH